MPVATVTAKKTQLQTSLLWSLILVAGCYLSELVHLLEEPLFKLVYHGNLNEMFFGVIGAGVIFGLLLSLHKTVVQKTEINVMQKNPEPISMGRRAVLYFMTVIPILSVALALGREFKIVQELGDRISKMAMVGNAAAYVLAAAKICVAVYVIFLTDKAVENRVGKQVHFPFGGLFAMLTMGAAELFVTPSAFSLLYFFLFFYFGILAKVTRYRFGLTFVLALVLYIL